MRDIKRPPLCTSDPTEEDLEHLRKYVWSFKRAHTINIVERTDAVEYYHEADWIKYIDHYLVLAFDMGKKSGDL